MIKTICDICRSENVVNEAKEYTICESCMGKRDAEVGKLNSALNKKVEKIDKKFGLFEEEVEHTEHTLGGGYYATANGKREHVQVCLTRPCDYEVRTPA